MYSSLIHLTIFVLCAYGKYASEQNFLANFLAKFIFTSLHRCLAGASALPETFIVGGSPVRIEDFYWQVLLIYKDIPFCGGAIVTARKIVTAAHCTDTRDMTRLKLRAGSTQPNAGGVIASVAKIIQHPSYSLPTVFNNDIAVIVLREALVFSPAIGSISLGSVDPSTGTMVTVSGYGVTSIGGDKAGDLRSVNVPVIDQNVCARNYKDYPGKAKVTDNMLCAGIAGKDACTGDSGGSLSFRL